MHLLQRQSCSQHVSELKLTPGYLINGEGRLVKGRQDGAANPCQDNFSDSRTDWTLALLRHDDSLNGVPQVANMRSTGSHSCRDTIPVCN